MYFRINQRNIDTLLPVEIHQSFFWILHHPSGAIKFTTRDTSVANDLNSLNIIRNEELVLCTIKDVHKSFLVLSLSYWSNSVLASHPALQIDGLCGQLENRKDFWLKVCCKIIIQLSEGLKAMTDQIIMTTNLCWIQEL